MKKKCFQEFVFLFLLFLSLTSISSSIEIIVADGKVDIEIVKFIAQKITEETWGKCSIGPIIVCYSAKGNISSYMVVLRLGDELCKSSEEILLDIEKKQKMNQDIIESLKRNKSSYNESQNIQERLIDARRELYGVGEYCTVVVSADYKYHPVPRYFQGLPAYFVNLTESKKIAEKSIGENELQLTYYNLGHGGEYFLYTNGYVDLLISARSLEVSKDGKNFLMNQISKGGFNEEITKQIKKSWLYWLELYYGN